MKWMRSDGEAALGMDELDRPHRRQAGRHPLGEPPTAQMPVQRGDFLADDEVDAERRVRGGEVAGGERAADLVVIRDGQDVEAPPRRREDDRLGRLSSVAPVRVDVQVGATENATAPACAAGE